MMPDIKQEAWRWPHFSRDNEMRCKCGCGKCGMDPAFMDLLEELREEFGKPFKITSGYRCPDYNATVGSTGRTGPHTSGLAVDISIGYADLVALDALIVRKFAYDVRNGGITGRGFSQKNSSRFYHIDSIPTFSKQIPRPRIWSY